MSNDHDTNPSPDSESAFGPPYVYFIQRGHDGPIKIGWTGRPSVQTRLADLQTSSPHPLYLRAVIPRAEPGHEGQLHRRFRAIQIQGEWFWPAKQLLAYIVNFALPWNQEIGKLELNEQSQKWFAATTEDIHQEPPISEDEPTDIECINVSIRLRKRPVRTTADPADNRAIGARLAEAIRAVGLDHGEAARRIGVSRAAVSLWCEGRTLPTLARFARTVEVLGLDPAILFPEWFTGR